MFLNFRQSMTWLRIWMGFVLMVAFARLVVAALGLRLRRGRFSASRCQPQAL